MNGIVSELGNPNAVFITGTMRDFGRKTLGQVFGSEAHGEAYAEILSHWDADSLTKDHVRQVDPSRRGFHPRIAGSACDTVAELQRYQFWEWLQQMVKGKHKRHYVSLFPI